MTRKEKLQWNFTKADIVHGDYVHVQFNFSDNFFVVHCYGASIIIFTIKFSPCGWYIFRLRSDKVFQSLIHNNSFKTWRFDENFGSHFSRKTNTLSFLMRMLEQILEKSCLWQWHFVLDLSKYNCNPSTFKNILSFIITKFP